MVVNSGISSSNLRRLDNPPTTHVDMQFTKRAAQRMIVSRHQNSCPAITPSPIIRPSTQLPLHQAARKVRPAPGRAGAEHPRNHHPSLHAGRKLHDRAIVRPAKPTRSASNNPRSAPMSSATSSRFWRAAGRSRGANRSYKTHPATNIKRLGARISLRPQGLPGRQ